MRIEFATCVRKTALEYIQTIYPERTIEDTPESAGPLLDFVEKDLVRVQDPMMYGNRISIIPGSNWVEDAAMRAEIAAACKVISQGEMEGR